jgi:hypothetical protein
LYIATIENTVWNETSGWSLLAKATTVEAPHVVWNTQQEVMPIHAFIFYGMKVALSFGYHG